MSSFFERLLQNHIAAPFPASARGTEVQGTDLVILDADIAALASSYRDEGHLTVEQGEILRGCAKELQRIEPDLPPDSKEYFHRLAALAQAVIREAPIRRSSVK